MTNENNTTITLAPDPRGNYVTWAQGKKQVRALLKTHGYTPVGTFRMRKENKNEFMISATKDSEFLLVKVARKPNAPFVITPNPIAQ